MREKLAVVLVWHMHQPYYKDPLTGEYILPWTYLHAVKDYYDMAAIVDEVEGARAVFNFVPSLLEQLEDYAAGTARDPFLLHGKLEPSAMGEKERLFVIENFFAANRQRLIEPHRRYSELFRLAGEESGSDPSRLLRQFRDQDILDLQVCFFLAWTGEAARRRYPQLQALVAKGRGYTPEDKALLFECHGAILREIFPLYRKLHAEGKAELAVTPYFHPIMPLLCDLKSASVAMPRVHLPSVPFRHPEDVRSQIVAGAACFQRIFGFPPSGSWPSEGSISDDVLAIMADCNIAWAASDEGVLSASLGGLGIGKEALFHSYLFDNGGKEIALFFREHTLADLIGFTYSQWVERRAIADFIGRLRSIAANQPEARVVPVILDGENAWEYYPDNGYHFLKGLYTALAEADDLRPATCSDLLTTGEGRRLQHVHPGSWINANFGIWIGHPEENRAWEYLARAREAAVTANSSVAALLAAGVVDLDAVEDRVAAGICRDLFAAQGSDWFWWYGDDHFSAHSDQFDLLFRRHLMSIYRSLGMEIPTELYEPIKTTGPVGIVRLPAGFITPEITGVAGDYFKWLAAGQYDLSRQGSAMHAATSPLRSFYYGFDARSLYFRVDGEQPLERMILSGDLLTFHVVGTAEFRVQLSLPGGPVALQKKVDGSWVETEYRCSWAIGKICELAVPLTPLGLAPGDYLFVSIVHQRGADNLGRWPADVPLKLSYAGNELELDTWLI